MYGNGKYTSTYFCVMVVVGKSEFAGGVLMKMKRLVLCAIGAFLIMFLICSSIQNRHTITLSNDEGIIKAEQIQPLWRTVKKFFLEEGD